MTKDRQQEREQQVRETMRLFGLSRQKAEFIVAIERGESKGDCVAITDGSAASAADTIADERTTADERVARSSGYISQHVHADTGCA